MTRVSEQPYRVIRSARRTRSVQARLVGGVVEIRIPARFSQAQEAQTVEEMLARVAKKTQASALNDANLTARATQLNREVLDGRARVGSIRWVDNQQTRWGSCTTTTGDIRISSLSLIHI